MSVTGLLMTGIEASHRLSGTARKPNSVFIPDFPVSSYHHGIFTLSHAMGRHYHQLYTSEVISQRNFLKADPSIWVSYEGGSVMPIYQRKRYTCRLVTVRCKGTGFTLTRTHQLSLTFKTVVIFEDRISGKY